MPSNLTAATRSVLESRFFIDLDPTLNMHYTLSETKTLAGDFDISAKFTHLNDVSTVLLGLSTAASDFIVIFVGNSFTVKFNGTTTSPGVIIPTADDGKLHEIRYVRTGSEINVFFDGVLVQTFTNSAPFTFDVIGRNNLGFEWDGVIADVEIKDLSTPNNSIPVIRLNQPTSNTQVVGSITVTYNNIPTSSRELYTKQVNGDFLGVELAINGRFDTDTIWTKEAPWLISGGTASITGFVDLPTNIEQLGIAELGMSYQTSYQINDIGLSGLQIAFGASVGTPRNSTGIHTEVIANVVSADLKLFNTATLGAGLTIDIDNVSVKRILEAA